MTKEQLETFEELIDAYIEVSVPHGKMIREIRKFVKDFQIPKQELLLAVAPRFMDLEMKLAQEGELDFEDGIRRSSYAALIQIFSILESDGTVKKENSISARGKDWEPNNNLD